MLVLDNDDCPGRLNAPTGKRQMKTTFHDTETHKLVPNDRFATDDVARQTAQRDNIRNNFVVGFGMSVSWTTSRQRRLISLVLKALAICRKSPFQFCFGTNFFVAAYADFLQKLLNRTHILLTEKIQTARPKRVDLLHPCCTVQRCTYRSNIMSPYDS